MIDYKELNAISAGLRQVSDGTYQKSKPKRESWIVESVEDDQLETYIQAISEAYESDSNEFEFLGEKYEVEFVKEANIVEVKKNTQGTRSNVLLNGQVVRTFVEAHSAKVYAVQLEHAQKTAAKKKFSKKLISSVSKVS